MFTNAFSKVFIKNNSATNYCEELIKKRISDALGCLRVAVRRPELLKQMLKNPMWVELECVRNKLIMPATIQTVQAKVTLDIVR